MWYSSYLTRSGVTAHDAAEERHECEGARVLGERCPVRPHIDGYRNRCHRAQHRPQALRRPAPCHISAVRGESTCVTDQSTLLPRPTHLNSLTVAMRSKAACRLSCMALSCAQEASGSRPCRALAACRAICHRITSARRFHKHLACSTVKKQ